MRMGLRLPARGSSAPPVARVALRDEICLLAALLAFVEGRLPVAEGALGVSRLGH